MCDWLFDAQGQQRLAHNSFLRIEYSAAMATPAFCTYAVKNLGFSRVVHRLQGTHVWFRPRVIAQPALAGTLSELIEHSPRRILLYWFDRSWQLELLSNPGSAVTRILALTELEHCRRDKRFRREPIDPHALPSSHPLAAIRAAWTAVSGQSSRNEIEQVLCQLGTERYALVTHDLATDELRLMSYGPGYEAIAKRWVNRSEGERLEDQADHAYGSWISTSYRGVAQSGVPALDAIDVKVEWPETGSQSYHYLRLLVPFTSGNQQIILSASVANDPLVRRAETVDEVA